MRRDILSVFYGNPDYYPPIINSSHLLAEAGYEHQILCREYLDTWQIDYPPNLHIERVSSRTHSSLLEYVLFLRAAFKGNTPVPKILIGHDMHGFLVARLLGWRYRRPVVYHCHDFVENGRHTGIGGKLVKMFEKRFARTADLVVVPDAERAGVIVDQLKLNFFPQIVANAPLQVPQESEGLLRSTLSDLGYHFDKVVLRQGRIGRGHCIEITIRSIPHWQNLNWGLVIMGRGEPDYKESLMRLAEDLGVKDRFVILPEVPYSDVLRYTVEADLGHALYEPININNEFINTASNKIMEYMSVGLPVILSETTSSAEFLKQYPIGTTAPIDSPARIAQAVNELLSQSDVTNAMSQTGKQAFDEYFRYDKQYAPVIDFIGKAIGT